MWDAGAALGLGALAGVMVILGAWTLFWKGIAFWRAAKNGQVIWFIAFLLIHTAGILEIVYLLWFRKDKDTRSFASLFSFGTPKVPEQVA
jgi:hypothetical protein